MAKFAKADFITFAVSPWPRTAPSSASLIGVATPGGRVLKRSTTSAVRDWLVSPAVADVLATAAKTAATAADLTEVLSLFMSISYVRMRGLASARRVQAAINPFQL
jgi:hypothetical protein